MQPNIDGIFAETRLDVAYELDRPTSEFAFGLSYSQLDYQLLTGAAAQSILVDGEDQTQSTVNATYSKIFTNRLTGVFTAAYELQEYDNRADKTDAYLFTADLAYTLTRSLNLELSIAHDMAEGVNTRGTADDPIEVMIDETETRAILGVRWLPPTRASRELTVELKSLLN